MRTDLCYVLILQVLTESEQMRKEADNIGPRAELDHWKKRMSKFNFLLEQIKGSKVKAVVGVLQAAKSKTIKVSHVDVIWLSYGNLIYSFEH